MLNMKNKTRYWFLGLVFFALALFPFFLNWILQKKSFVPVVGDGVTWLSFWPVYLSAIASFGMIYMTYLSLKQSKEHIEDLKKRDADEHRARLVFSVVVYQYAFYLRIYNVGKENAFNVKLNFNDEFIDAIKEQYRKYYQQLSQPDFIEAGKSIYILIGWCEDVDKEWEGKEIMLSVNGTYNDKYVVNDSLDMGHFIGKTHFIVKGELETIMEYMKKGVVMQNSSYNPIQKSLDDIAYTMKRIDYSLMELTKQIEHSEDIQGMQVETKQENSVDSEEEISTESIPVLRD